MKPIIVTVHGITPLLANNYQAMMAPPEVGGKTRKSIPSAAAEAEAGTYRDIAGNLVHPTAAFRKCAISGGKGRKIGRSSLTTILTGTLFPGDEGTTLEDPTTHEPLREYEIDTRRAVVNRTAAVLRSRPKMFPWSAQVHLEYDDDDMDEASVIWALGQGGSKVGVGNYRPEKGGMFGRFEVLG